MIIAREQRVADSLIIGQAVGRFEEAIADCKTAIENDPEVCIPIFMPDKSMLSLQIQLLGPSQFLTWHLARGAAAPLGAM